MNEIELWSDSFHEGQWFCDNITKQHQLKNKKFKLEYIQGFIPKLCLEFENTKLFITVFGDYKSWEHTPSKIKELIKWGKPDFIAYDRNKDEILFAVEETAAVPTGNQALQRCERLFGAAKSKIPFWYLLAEYGVHRDTGVRRDSIWPTIMALKIALIYKIPCNILHYSDLDNPEGYDFGNGVKQLFIALYQILENQHYNKKILQNFEKILSNHVTDMFRFVKSQYKNIVSHLPNFEDHNNSDFIKSYVDFILKKNSSLKTKDFLHWPNTKKWYEEGGEKISSSELIKNDKFCYELEKSLDKNISYTLSNNAGSRPQSKNQMLGWIKSQNNLFRNGIKKISDEVDFQLNIKDFPTSQNGNYHLTTAKNIIYFYDKFHDLNNIITKTFPRLKNLLDEFDRNKLSLIYLSNSIKPGRLFGDPFTGQISCFNTIFGKFDNNSRISVAYFPHQSYTQILDTDNRLVENKGFQIMRELLDFIIFGGGVLVKFNKDGRADVF